MREANARNQQLLAQRYSVSKETNELRLHCRLVEESLAQVKQDHTPCGDKLHEVEEQRDTLKREAADVRRALGEAQRELAAYQKQSEDLKVKLRTSDAERVENGRALQETRQQLARTRFILIHTFLLLILTP